jgi:NAD(P)-dependent dehydrogenase (short-subunit alcohol dehydrogenase family)
MGSSSLFGRVAFVTGAGQGIGEGVARALAARGATVALAGRTLAKVEAVAEELRAEGGAATAIGCDVGERAQVDAAIAQAVSEFGQLDVVVNNAQSSTQNLLEETTASDVELCWRSGALGTYHVMQAAFPHLRTRGGSVINVGSTTAIIGDPTFAAYAMAKEAIRGLSRVAAKEWGKYGIRVNVIVPTALSPSARAFGESEPERFAGYLAQIPLGRMGDPQDDIGRAVASLASDDLQYLTGATLMLNGGRVLLG